MPKGPAESDFLMGNFFSDTFFCGKWDGLDFRAGHFSHC